MLQILEAGLVKIKTNIQAVAKHQSTAQDKHAHLNKKS